MTTTSLVGMRERRSARPLRSFERDGRVRLRPAPEASNVFELEMAQALAEQAFLRSQSEGVRIGRAQGGVMPFFVNETILRRPVEDYVRVFLG